MPAPALDPSAWPHLWVQGTGPLLLMLHGTGSSESQIAALATQLDPTAAVLAPRGRVTENGAGRWFRRRAEGVFDVDDVIERAGELAGFVTWAQSEYARDDRPLVAIGFSNGANMALALASRHPEVVSHVIAFSGMYPFADRDIQAELGETSVLLLNGSDDPMAPAASVDRLEAQLETHHATVERVTRPGGHGITEDELAAARRWLGRTLSS